MYKYKTLSVSHFNPQNILEVVCNELIKGWEILRADSIGDTTFYIFRKPSTEKLINKDSIIKEIKLLFSKAKKDVKVEDIINLIESL